MDTKAGRENFILSAPTCALNPREPCAQLRVSSGVGSTSGGHSMRKSGIGLFAFVLWLSFSAIAQDAGGQQPSDQQQPSASQGQTSPSDQGAASQGQSQPSDQGSMSQGSTSGKKMGKAVHLRGKI